MRRSVVLVAISAASLTAMPAVASAKTLRLFSKPIDKASGQFDPNGNPIGESQQPPVGSFFVGGDRDYKGTAKHHSKSVFGYDHIVCTVIDTSAHARCNANIVLRDGAVYANNFVLDLAARQQVIKVTAGTGRYRRATTVTNRNIGDTGNAELVIRYH